MPLPPGRAGPGPGGRGGLGGQVELRAHHHPQAGHLPRGHPGQRGDQRRGAVERGGRLRRRPPRLRRRRRRRLVPAGRGSSRRRAAARRLPPTAAQARPAAAAGRDAHGPGCASRREARRRAGRAAAHRAGRPGPLRRAAARRPAPPARGVAAPASRCTRHSPVDAACRSSACRAAARRSASLARGLSERCASSCASATWLVSSSSVPVIDRLGQQQPPERPQPRRQQPVLQRRPPAPPARRQPRRVRSASSTSQTPASCTQHGTAASSRAASPPGSGCPRAPAGRVSTSCPSSLPAARPGPAVITRTGPPARSRTQATATGADRHHADTSSAARCAAPSPGALSSGRAVVTALRGPGYLGQLPGGQRRQDLPWLLSRHHRAPRISRLATRCPHANDYGAAAEAVHCKNVTERVDFVASSGPRGRPGDSAWRQAKGITPS